MSAHDLTDICPAFACATDVIRLEAEIARTIRLMNEAERACALGAARSLERILDDLFLAADEARERLAEADALSFAGAIAQLLAAVRDIRVQDDHERKRARDLEARAIRALEAGALFDRASCRALSQSSLGARLGPCAPPHEQAYPASRDISASEIS